MKDKFHLRSRIQLFFVLILILSQFKRIASPGINEFRYMVIQLITNPHISYEEKMKLKVGEIYFDWTKLVKEHTFINSIIMHPPQMWPWPQSGNLEFSQYFLYPAKLVREDHQRLASKGDITHVLIAWGEAEVKDARYYGWPKFPVLSQKIYYLPQRRQVSVRGLDNLYEWKNQAERTINSHKDNFLDLTYTSSEYDYWVKPVNMVLTPSTKLDTEIKSNWPDSTALIAEVSYGNFYSAVFSSSPNQKVDQWEILNIDDLYLRAYQFGRLEGWPTNQLKIISLGIDTGHPAKIPYLERWGVIEVEKGGEARKQSLKEALVNSQNYLSLGDIASLDKDQLLAAEYFEKSALLEPSNAWPHYYLAKTADLLGEKNIAELEFKKTIDLLPDLAWGYYALGEFYRGNKDLNEAIFNYQKAIDLYPEAIWARRALAETYESLGMMRLAYQQYRLASEDLRWALSDDGRVAQEKAKGIEAKEEKIIRDSLRALEINPNDWDSRLKLADAYNILGQANKAREQSRIASKEAPEEYRRNTSFQFEPLIIDKISQPIYGIFNKNIELDQEKGTEVILDNYRKYIEYSRDILPLSNGTIQLTWKPPPDFYSDLSPRNLVFQFRGLFIWINQGKLHYALFDNDSEKWQIISSSIQWDINKWYEISASFGQEGMHLLLDSKLVGQSAFGGGLSVDNDMYLGRGPLWPSFEKIISAGYFDTLKIFDTQKL
jgi:tetratricopeptide (TPR) repeat protein